MWVVLVVACTQGPEERIDVVCNTFCDCTSTLPAAVEMCVTQQCKPHLTIVSDACLACVYDHESTCSTLDTECMTTCFQVVDMKGPE